MIKRFVHLTFGLFLSAMWLGACCMFFVILGPFALPAGFIAFVVTMYQQVGADRSYAAVRRRAAASAEAEQNAHDGRGGLFHSLTHDRNTELQRRKSHHEFIEAIPVLAVTNLALAFDGIVDWFVPGPPNSGPAVSARQDELEGAESDDPSRDRNDARRKAKQRRRASGRR